MSGDLRVEVRGGLAREAVGKNADARGLDGCGQRATDEDGRKHAERRWHGAKRAAAPAERATAVEIGMVEA